MKTKDKIKKLETELEYQKQLLAEADKRLREQFQRNYDLSTETYKLQAAVISLAKKLAENERLDVMHKENCHA